MYIYWKNIKFLSKKEINFEQDILSAQLITVPAAPSMVESKNNPWYYEALENATYSVMDSGLFSLLCKLHGINAQKYSGYRLIQDMLAYLKQQPLKLFVVSPRPTESEKIKQLLLSETACKEKDLTFYNAPMYPAHANVEDPELAEQINTFQPDLVMLCIAGGKQEIMGHFLQQKIIQKSTIICTGAAISFFTGTQAKIPSMVDKLYLGWLARIIADPKTFLPRYLNAFKYVFWFWKFRSSLRTEEE
ncbi:WecB/TagA/CpsF family glycosyltransferase [Draconibacterium sp. IB214405]|uniref:WecB/TagA/CpsF family glycosyltransferase n=1 Tax=Draconibacterium sp. IB214405 TaxID=3097352 RepID=UPI002A0F0A6E|nr:WecB/TagA/CpsF family glycosyltransferase [Draconibacterium sp. IB214405]MDX8339289.1 WecB/TagA/CpsF family glycosyltransferase [Draconibacterium sp. IB214405]